MLAGMQELMASFFIRFFNFLSSLDDAKSSHPEVFLGKGVLKICSTFTGENHAKASLQ